MKKSISAHASAGTSGATLSDTAADALPCGAVGSSAVEGAAENNGADGGHMICPGSAANNDDIGGGNVGADAEKTGDTAGNIGGGHISVADSGHISDYKSGYIFAEDKGDSGGAQAVGADADAEVERALYRLAVGFVARERHVKQGRSGPESTLVEKDVPPNFSAVSFWLRSRLPERWGDNADAAALSLRKLDDILDQLSGGGGQRPRE